MAGIFKNWDSPALCMGGVEDRVHVLFSLSKNYPLTKIVEEVKSSSSKWMKIEGTHNDEFFWQRAMQPSQSASLVWGRCETTSSHKKIITDG